MTNKTNFAKFLLLSAALVCVTVFSAQAAPLEVAKVKGQVEILKSGAADWIPAEKGMALSQGDQVRTGDEGKLELSRDKTKLTIYKDSNFQVKEWDHDNDKMEAKLDLSLGKLKAKVKKLNPGDNFEIVTPTSTAAVRGTTFVVWVYESMGQLFTQLDVLDDVVEFSDLSQQQSQVVTSGFQAVLGSGGFVTPEPDVDQGGAGAPAQEVTTIGQEVGNAGGFQQDTPGSQMNESGSPVVPEAEMATGPVDG